MLASIRSALAPTGTLRAGINLSNFLLVSSRGPNGEPIGVSPDIAAALASKLEVPLELVPYANPGLLSDAAGFDEWDIGLIGAEPERAETIAFTAPYAEIEATYMVKPGSGLCTVAEVDRPGVRVAVAARAAYDLWLTANLGHATLRRPEEPGLDRARALFDAGDDGGAFDALAGLRPWLLDQVATAPVGARVLDGSFTTVQQAIGLPRGRADGGASLFLEQFVAETKGSLVAALIEKHGQTGRLSVAR